MRRRGQGSMEFTILFGVMLMAVTLLLVVAYDVLDDARIDQREAAVRAVEEAAVREMDLAARSVDGYEREFSLPTVIEGTPYTLVIVPDGSGKDFLVSTWGGTVRTTFLDHDVSGTVGPGRNRIRKTAGVVTVTNG